MGVNDGCFQTVEVSTDNVSDFVRKRTQSSDQAHQDFLQLSGYNIRPALLRSWVRFLAKSPEIFAKQPSFISTLYMQTLYTSTGHSRSWFSILHCKQSVALFSKMDCAISFSYAILNCCFLIFFQILMIHFRKKKFPQQGNATSV